MQSPDRASDRDRQRRIRLCLPLGLALCGIAVSCSPDYVLWAGAPQRSDRGSTATLVGELTTLTSRRLTVETHNDEVALGIAKSVRVTIDGKKAELRELQPRQFVEIETEEQGRELLASVISARSRMR